MTIKNRSIAKNKNSDYYLKNSIRYLKIQRIELSKNKNFRGLDSKIRKIHHYHRDRKDFRSKYYFWTRLKYSNS
ncbi:hypothetical protein BGP_3639 [Beggiatoa sp. PS]|nr:hypothetical protein BGP_3639 [Beggiatoa sp. PS]